MDGETHSIPVEQVCNPRRWQHQLLEALEQRTQDTNLWIWWNSSLHVANRKTNAKDGSQILSSNLARQRPHQQTRTPWAFSTWWLGSRTIRRQVKPEKYNKQLLDVINNTPMTTPTASSFIILPAAKMKARPKITTETDIQNNSLGWNWNIPGFNTLKLSATGRSTTEKFSRTGAQWAQQTTSFVNTSYCKNAQVDSQQCIKILLFNMLMVIQQSDVQQEHQSEGRC